MLPTAARMTSPDALGARVCQSEDAARGGNWCILMGYQERTHHYTHFAQV